MDIQPAELWISYTMIEAKTPIELERLMVTVQASSGKPINYTPPQYVNGKWSTWYHADLSSKYSALARMKTEHNKTRK